MSGGLIEFSNAAYAYSGRPLFSDLSVSVRPGGFYFLTGPSGAGKTTFLRLCAMELRPSGGTLKLFGEPVAALDRDHVARTRRRIGQIHQDCRFIDHLTVQDNITLPLELAGRDPAEGADDLEELLRWVGLTARANAYPPELSGGERQRAALARAVIGAPDLILADEPTGNVDWEMSERLLSLLVQLNQMGRTIVVATHDLPLIRSARGQTAVRVLRLQGGRLFEASSAA